MPTNNKLPSQQIACRLILSETRGYETVLERLEAQGARSRGSRNAKNAGRADLWRLYADHQTTLLYSSDAGHVGDVVFADGGIGEGDTDATSTR
jgi:hypothetical protein